jgi:hypothetical protein
MAPPNLDALLNHLSPFAQQKLAQGDIHSTKGQDWTTPI